MDQILVPEIALKAYESWTNLRLCIHDHSGLIRPFIDPVRTRHSGKLCRLAKSSPFSDLCVSYEVTQLTPLLLSLKNGRSQCCHAGLVEWVVPVLDEGHVLAVLFAGQIIAEKQNWQADYHAQRSPLKIPKGGVKISKENAEVYLEGLRQLAARLLLWIRESKGENIPSTRVAKIFAYIDRSYNESPSLAQLSKKL